MAISGPIAPYSNVPIHPEYYKPSRFQISNIVIGLTTLITVNPEIYPFATVNLNYVLGQEVRVLIPNGYGCRQLNEKTGLVISLPTLNQVEISIDSHLFDSFINASLKQAPQIMAIGDVNTGHINLNNKCMKPWIPGSFRDISPK